VRLPVWMPMRMCARCAQMTKRSDDEDEGEQMFWEP
jgi:hypothetical protein